ncbi:MAG: 5'-deoxynucleotidase [Ruminococcaceae bacterium]|nr:5'-deoxynucleotidase [Oscillospiraceae bacterium]
MSKEQYNFYAYISRMKYIMRWGLMRNTVSENIQEHSLQVAILAHSLAYIHNSLNKDNPLMQLDPAKACVYAVFHDANEIITGDMPTPIKYYNPVIKEHYHKIEDISKDKLLSMLPQEMESYYRDIMFYEERDPEYYPIVKAADKLSAYLKCVEEVKAGNNEFTKAKESIYAGLQEMDCPALKYFLEHFTDSFELTLDELE